MYIQKHHAKYTESSEDRCTDLAKIKGITVKKKKYMYHIQNRICVTIGQG